MTEFFSKIALKSMLIGGVFLVSGCQTFTGQHETLFTKLGGMPKLENIVDNFIDEIAFEKTIYRYFEDSDIERFRTKMLEHLCLHTGGPCEYTGDNMRAVHAGMNINEKDFNRTVELLINAMNAAKIPAKLQNELLRILAPMRKDIIYI